ncbi:MAG TPA: hypothetical protein PKY88_12295 [Anaerohalosphaeraceae bacterium]|nr:hypothetical protein [Anaerohalosphaeraceae bacterium]
MTVSCYKGKIIYISTWLGFFASCSIGSLLCCVFLYTAIYALSFNIEIYIGFLAFFGLPFGSLIATSLWSIISKFNLHSADFLSGYISSILFVLLFWLLSQALTSLPGGDKMLAALFAMTASLGFCVGIAFSKWVLQQPNKLRELSAEKTKGLSNTKLSAVVGQIGRFMAGAIGAFLFIGLLYLAGEGYFLFSYTSSGAAFEDVFLGFLTFFGLPLGNFIGRIIWNLFSVSKLQAVHFLSGYVSSTMFILMLWFADAAMGGKGTGARLPISMRRDELFILFPLVSSLGFSIGFVCMNWWRKSHSDKNSR